MLVTLCQLWKSLEPAKAASGMAAISMVGQISAVIGIAMIGTISEVIGNMTDYAVCEEGRGHSVSRCYGKPVQEHNSVQPPFETGFGFRKVLLRMPQLLSSQSY